MHTLQPQELKQRQQLAKAIAIVARVFQDVLDKGGQPYVLHCLWVMNQLDSNDPELQQIGVMHDLQEDYPVLWSEKTLYLEGFSPRVVTALGLLNHDKANTPYMRYIHQLSVNEDCVKVKRADLRHNSDITRLKGITEKDMARMVKYNEAYAFLTSPTIFLAWRR